jgi:hypothetical protein
VRSPQKKEKKEKRKKKERKRKAGTAPVGAHPNGIAVSMIISRKIAAEPPSRLVIVTRG